MTTQTTYGSETGVVTIGAGITNGGYGESSCGASFIGLDGDMKVWCSEGNLTINDTTTCTEAACVAGSQVTMPFGHSESFVPSASQSYASGQTLLQDCAKIDSAYEGNVTLTCSRGSWSAVSNCTLVEGIDTETVNVVSSTLSMQLPAVSGKTVDEVHTSMQSDSAKEAVTKSLASGIGVSSNSVTVPKINVVQSTRRLTNLRRLSTGNMNMHVDYQVIVPQSSGSLTNVQNAMQNIGNSASQAGTSFASNFQTNLAQAAAQDTSLSSLSTAVQNSGVTITGATAPSVSTRVVPVTTTQETTSAAPVVPSPTPVVPSPTPQPSIQAINNNDDDGISTEAWVAIFFSSVVCLGSTAAVVLYFVMRQKTQTPVEQWVVEADDQAGLSGVKSSAPAQNAGQQNEVQGSSQEQSIEKLRPAIGVADEEGDKCSEKYSDSKEEQPAVAAGIAFVQE